MKFRHYAIFSVILFFAVTEIRAEVFSLWPFSRKSSSGSNGEIPEQNKLWNEPVEINGLSLDLCLSITDTSMQELIARMKKMNPQPRIHPGPDATLIIIPLKDGKAKKILLVQLSAATPVMIFTMEVPEKLPSTFDWPAQLPFPPGAEAENYMYFPNRKSYFGMFMVSGGSSSPAQDSLRSSLEASGWKPFDQQAQGTEGEGCVFVRDNPPGMAITAFSPVNQEGKSRGTIYMCPLK